MRYIVGLFGVGCAIVITWIAWDFGVSMSDDGAQAQKWGFAYAAITAAGLGGHTIGARMLRYERYGIGCLIFLACFAALMLSLSNSLGAMTERAGATQALRLQRSQAVENAKRDLVSAQNERDTLLALKASPTEWSAVEAARTKAESYTNARKDACTPPSDGTSACERKRKAEQAALDELSVASKNKTATERLRQLPGEIEKLKAKIESEGPVLEANAQGAALVRLLGLDASRSGEIFTKQNFAIAACLEIIIALAITSYEVLDQHEAKPKPAPSSPTNDPRPVRAQRTRAARSKPDEIMQADVALLPPPAVERPVRKPIAAGNGGNAAQAGHLTLWWQDCVVVGEGSRFQNKVFRQSYEDWCKAKKIAPVGPNPFGKFIIGEIGEDAREKDRGYTFYHGIKLKLAALQKVG